MPNKKFREAPLTSEEIATGNFLIMELPLKGRADMNMKTPCKYCRQNIDYPANKTFIAVVTERTDNYMYHRECYPKSTFDSEIYQNGDPECADCGHPYHRHYDLFEENEPPVGCKYCDCAYWVPPEDWKYPRGKLNEKNNQKSNKKA